MKVRMRIDHLPGVLEIGGGAIQDVIYIDWVCDCGTKRINSHWMNRHNLTTALECFLNFHLNDFRESIRNSPCNCWPMMKIEAAFRECAK